MKGKKPVLVSRQAFEQFFPSEQPHRYCLPPEQLLRAPPGCIAAGAVFPHPQRAPCMPTARATGARPAGKPSPAWSPSERSGHRRAAPQEPPATRAGGASAASPLGSPQPGSVRSEGQRLRGGRLCRAGRGREQQLTFLAALTEPLFKGVK